MANGPRRSCRREVSRVPSQNRDQGLRWLSRALLLILIGSLVGGSVWWLAWFAISGEMDPAQTVAVARRPARVMLVLALAGVAVTAAAFAVVVRSRRNALAALRTADEALREQVDLSRS